MRLSPDEWMYRIVGDGYDTARRHAVDAVQWEIAARALSLGVNVILENGFWSRSERDNYRARATSMGVSTKLHFLDVPLDELRRRLRMRNVESPPDTFHITEADLMKWAKSFEYPTVEELR